MPKPSIRNPQSAIRNLKCRVGVDTGGTFTDFVFESENGLRVFKLASTPADPSQAIIEGLRRVERETGGRFRSFEVIHGTTAGTNALLERRGARTALVTTRGFEDVLAIGRQARPALYNLNADRPAPLVPASLRFGVRERVSAFGEVLEPLDERSLGSLVAKLKRERVESVAICLLFSFNHPEHEQRVARSFAGLGIPLSISHEILPEYREYERTSTVSINAYLQPLMGRYLRRLAAHAPNLRVMQSSGGSISAAAAAEEPVHTILSGPAGGVVGALRVAGRCGIKNLITFDMGGTSTDVALCDDKGMRVTREAVVAGMPVAVSMMDIHTVGAGGGSIAQVDDGGALRVGPESAGADPGPACYGRSLLPTVTDAHLVLGHFGGAGLLGGEWKLDEARARKAVGKLAEAMSKAARRRINTVEAAQGVLRVVSVNMERALRAISVERGFDPRDFTLVPFGGAGGLHAVELARSLKIPRILMPTSAGALSAIGALSSDVVRDASRTVMAAATEGSLALVERTFGKMERDARLSLAREGFSDAKQRHERMLAVRYQVQSFELDIPWPRRGTVADVFHRAHLARYGYAQTANTVEIVSARLRSVGVLQRSRVPTHAGRTRARKAAQPVREAVIHFARGRTRAGVYVREMLEAGGRLQTPCVVTDYSSTTLIPDDARAVVDGYRNLVIEL
jgi:N-methylhydantoinase A